MFQLLLCCLEQKENKEGLSLTHISSYLNQCLHLVQQDGFVAEFNQRFGDAKGERSQPGPISPNQDQSLHTSAVSERYQGNQGPEKRWRMKGKCCNDRTESVTFFI